MVLVDLPFQYALKRFVSKKSFWRKGLSAAWGNADLINDYTVLRYRWPSICYDWAKGLLTFSRAVPYAKYPGGDKKLLQDVLSLPNTTVVIVHGSKDRIVPIRNSQILVDLYPQIKLITLPGQGHNPFEEEVESFVSVVENVLS